MNMTRGRINDQFRKRKKDTAMSGGDWDDERKTAVIDRYEDPNGVPLDRVWDAEWRRNLADAALTACGDHLDQVIFVGFDWRGLLRIRQQSPSARCWFTTDNLQGDYLPMLDAIKAAGGDGWFPHHADATGLAISDAHARGLKIGAWTVNEKAEMAKLRKLGIDAICTDWPDLLQALK